MKEELVNQIKAKFDGYNRKKIISQINNELRDLNRRNITAIGNTVGVNFEKIELREYKYDENELNKLRLIMSYLIADVIAKSKLDTDDEDKTAEINAYFSDGIALVVAIAVVYWDVKYTLLLRKKWPRIHIKRYIEGWIEENVGYVRTENVKFHHRTYDKILNWVIEYVSFYIEAPDVIAYQRRKWDKEWSLFNKGSFHDDYPDDHFYDKGIEAYFTW